MVIVGCGIGLRKENKKLLFICVIKGKSDLNGKLCWISKRNMYLKRNQNGTRTTRLKIIIRTEKY